MNILLALTAAKRPSVSSFLLAITQAYCFIPSITISLVPVCFPLKDLRVEWTPLDPFLSNLKILFLLPQRDEGSILLRRKKIILNLFSNYRLILF